MLLAQSDPELLSRVATGRTESVFQKDLQASTMQLREAVEGRRVLVVGGAGTIGSATTAVLAGFGPAALHVIDQNENGLAELVRTLRSSKDGLGVKDFRTFPIDYGSRLIERVLDVSDYDVVMNFAALKHVRSERDLISLLQMFNTNLLKNRSLMRALSKRNFKGRYFCVSTDKAANPVSLMGASKRVMEHLIFGGSTVPQFEGVVTSARFANVAFSDGSLLQSFINRFGKRQVIAVPERAQRYFVSPRESGEICAIAALCPPGGTIVVPDFESSIHLVELEKVAELFVQARGFEPKFYRDENEAKQELEGNLSAQVYPVLLTPLDTSGEKPYEEFVGSGERAFDLGLDALMGVHYQPAEAEALSTLLELIEDTVDGIPDLTKAELVSAISAVVPEFTHRETGVYLDQRV